VGWSDLGWAMENLWAVSMGRQIFCMSTVGPPNKNPYMSTSKNKDINNKSKQNYPNYQMMLFVYTTTRSGRITANTPTGEQLSIVITVMNTLVKLNWWNYVCQYSAGVYLQCSYQQVFFIIKVYFPNLDWMGHENFFVRLDGL
jgi:hypothetical protein